jgi:hypothetical protein
VPEGEEQDRQLLLAEAEIDAGDERLGEGEADANPPA